MGEKLEALSFNIEMAVFSRGEQLTSFSSLASAPDEAFSLAPISLIPFRHLPNAGNLQHWANPAPTVGAHCHIWWEVSLLRRPCF